MKFTITFKDPDAVDSCLEDYPADKRDEMKEFAKQFLSWGEYVDVEFDTKEKTATVVNPH